MKILLYGRPSEIDHSEYIRHLVDILKSLNIDTFIYEPYGRYLNEKLNLKLELPIIKENTDLKDKIDFLFSIGGDGTILNTITIIRDSGIPIVGINAGKLGFLSSIPKDEFNTSIQKIINGNFIKDERTLLKLESNLPLFGKDNFALNEFTLQKYETNSMIHILAKVNEDFLNSYWADGLIISTPTGSTGYSLSCGGPIVTPDSQNFVISPIATHNLSVRPIIVPDTYVISLNVKYGTNKILIGLDSRYEIVDSSVELKISKQNFKINLVKIPDSNFFSTIRNKLKWGLDIRN